MYTHIHSRGKTGDEALAVVSFSLCTRVSNLNWLEHDTFCFSTAHHAWRCHARFAVPTCCYLQ